MLALFGPPAIVPPPPLLPDPATRVSIPRSVHAVPAIPFLTQRSVLLRHVLPLHPKRHGHWGSPSHSDLCCNFSSFTHCLPKLRNHCNVPCCVRVRLPVSIAEDLHVQSAQTRTEKQTRTRETNRANVWLQTVHEQEDQQQITFTHKYPIIKYNVHSFNVSFPRTVPSSPLRLSHSQCNPSPSLSLSTYLTHMKYLHWTIRRPSSHPVFPHLTIRQSQLSIRCYPIHQIPLRVPSTLQQ